MHIASSAHFKSVKKAAAIPSKTLHSFFNKTATSSPFEAPRSSSTLAPFRLSLLLTPGISPSLPIAQHPNESVSHLSVTPPPTTTGWLSLLNGLKAVIDSLPMEVPYGVNSDNVAVFAGSPRAHIQQDDEAWENLDPLLNQVVGYGATPEKISQCIQWGKFGMDGMYTWLKVCIEEPKLACDLFPFLEGRGGEGLRDLIQIKGPRILDFLLHTPWLQLGLLANGSYTLFPLPGPYNAG